MKVDLNQMQNLQKQTTLKIMEDKLSPRDFIRVHRSFIVNLMQVDEVAENHVIINQKSVPLSIQLREDLLKRIQTIWFLTNNQCETLNPLFYSLVFAPFPQVCGISLRSTLFAQKSLLSVLLKRLLIFFVALHPLSIFA